MSSHEQFQIRSYNILIVEDVAVRSVSTGATGQIVADDLLGHLFNIWNLEFNMGTLEQMIPVFEVKYVEESVNSRDENRNLSAIHKRDFGTNIREENEFGSFRSELTWTINGDDAEVAELGLGLVQILNHFIITTLSISANSNLVICFLIQKNPNER